MKFNILDLIFFSCRSTPAHTDIAVMIIWKATKSAQCREIELKCYRDFVGLTVKQPTADCCSLAQTNTQTWHYSRLNYSHSMIVQLLNILHINRKNKSAHKSNRDSVFLAFASAKTAFFIRSKRKGDNAPNTHTHKQPLQFKCRILWTQYIHINLNSNCSFDICTECARSSKSADWLTAPWAALPSTAHPNSPIFNAQNVIQSELFVHYNRLLCTIFA